LSEIYFETEAEDIHLGLFFFSQESVTRRNFIKMKLLFKIKNISNTFNQTFFGRVSFYHIPIDHLDKL